MRPAYQLRVACNLKLPCGILGEWKWIVDEGPLQHLPRAARVAVEVVAGHKPVGLAHSDAEAW